MNLSIKEQKKRGRRFHSDISQRVFISRYGYFSLSILSDFYYPQCPTPSIFVWGFFIFISFLLSPIRIYRFYFTQRRSVTFTGPHKPQASEIENKIILCLLNRFIRQIFLAHVNKLSHDLRRYFITT